MFLAGRPEVTRDDAAIDFDWGPDSPAPRISKDLFSVRWTRSLWLDTGTWRFTVRTDDGVRLWVDSVLLIDQWHNQPQATYTAMHRWGRLSHGHLGVFRVYRRCHSALEL